MNIGELAQKVDTLAAKLDMICNSIVTLDCEGRKADFSEKWSPRVAEIADDQKAMYGDDWSDIDGLWDFHEKNRLSEGYIEDNVINAYIDSVKEKFAKLKGIVTQAESTGEITSDQADAAEAAIETAETAIEAAEAVVDPAANPAEVAVVEIAKTDPKKDEEDIINALKSDVLLNYS